MNHGSNQRNTAAHARIQTRNMKCVLHVSRLHVGLRFLAGAQGVVFEFSFHAIHSIGLKFTIDKYIASIVPLRVLSRTNLAERTSLTSSISFISFRLRTLKLSCRSFCGSRPLFSITSALFLQNTRDGGVTVAPLSASVLPWLCGNPDLSPLAKGCKNTEMATLTTFRINTCKSVSKRRTLTTFRINTYKKPRGGGAPTRSPLQLPASSIQPPEPHAPRSAPIPCDLSRLPILPVTTGCSPFDFRFKKVNCPRAATWTFS